MANFISLLITLFISPFISLFSNIFISLSVSSVTANHHIEFRRES